MVIWGWRKRLLSLEQRGVHSCGHCQADRQFRLVLRYTYFHLYWLFGFVTQREYLLACDLCGSGYLLNATAVERTLETKPRIPAMQRYGLAGLVVAMAVLFVIGRIR